MLLTPNEIAMDSESYCSFCREPILLGPAQTWSTQEGVKLDVRTTSDVYILVESSLGELDLCEKCYIRETNFCLMTPADQRAIHMEFAIEYINRKRWNDALVACAKSLALGDDTNVHFLLGLVRTGLSQEPLAMEQYKRALELDPTNGPALGNLRILQKRQ